MDILYTKGGHKQMNYYIILLMLLTILTIVFNKLKYFDKLKQNKKYINIIFVILTLFLIVRAPEVGLDYENYGKIFEYAHEKSFVELLTFERHELGFKYYNKIISMIFNNYSFFLAVTSIVSIAGIYYYIKDNSKNYISSILIFVTFNYYAFLFSILRQAIAMSILLFSIKYIKEKKVYKFLILVVLAALFHKTALIFLPMYFIANIKISRKYLIIYLSAIAIIAVSGKYLLNLIFEYVYKPSTLEAVSGQGIKMLILLVGLAIFAYCQQEKLLKQDKNNQIYINSIFMAGLIQSIAPVFSLAHRAVMYYSIAMIVLIPNIIETFENKKIKMAVEITMYVVLILYFCYTTTNLIEYCQYKTIF